MCPHELLPEIKDEKNKGANGKIYCWSRKRYLEGRGGGEGGGGGDQPRPKTPLIVVERKRIGGEKRNKNAIEKNR